MNPRPTAFLALKDTRLLLYRLSYRGALTNNKQTLYFKICPVLQPQLRVKKAHQRIISPKSMPDGGFSIFPALLVQQIRMVPQAKDISCLGETSTYRVSCSSTLLSCLVLTRSQVDYSVVLGLYLAFSEKRSITLELRGNVA